MTVTTLEPTLTKKLLLIGQPKQRITGEAVLMANELLRLFIVEARQRAAIEAECENEADIDDNDQRDNAVAEKEQHGLGRTTQRGVSIRADHITKVAGELLMDFS